MRLGCSDAKRHEMGFLMPISFPQDLFPMSRFTTATRLNSQILKTGRRNKMCETLAMSVNTAEVLLNLQYTHNIYIHFYAVGLFNYQLYQKNTKSEWFKLNKILSGAKRCYPTGWDVDSIKDIRILGKICGLFGRSHKCKSLEYKFREAKELYFLSMFSLTSFCWDMKPSVCDHRNYIISVKSVW